MVARIKKWLTSSPDGKEIEHLAVVFGIAFGTTAIATAESAAGAHGFQLTWSFGAGVVVAGLKAGYDAVRTLLITKPEAK